MVQLADGEQVVVAMGPVMATVANADAARDATTRAEENISKVVGIRGNKERSVYAGEQRV